MIYLLFLGTVHCSNSAPVPTLILLSEVEEIWKAGQKWNIKLYRYPINNPPVGFARPKKIW